MRCITSTVVIVACVLLSVVHSVGAGHRVGVAAVDITPDYPVRLSGFGFRRTESEGVTQRIWAKALAFADDERGPAVLLTVDNLAIPAYMTEEVGRRLKENAKLDPARLAVTCTHTHTAPMLTNVAPTLFGMPIPPEHQRNIDRYTRELTDALERVSLAALADLKPARVEFGIGAADLAANRRTKGGPVDHDLPLLAVKDEDGDVRALYLSYACHCVTLSNNHISGDWAGYAQEAIQKIHPDAVALVSVGCGADSNPKSGVTGDKVEVAKSQGAQMADEVARMLKSDLTPITEPIITKLHSIELLFDTHPTREEWQEKAKRNDAIGHHARVQLAKLDRGEKLQTALTYPIQTWTFGDQLAMVFLPGEVVVDYSLRLKREFDRSRLWVNAYSNDNPCYIPSERILKEGGYEGGGAMVYYDRPTRLAAGVEQKIIEEVHRQLPENFRASKGTEGVAPRSPEASLRSIRTKSDLEVELVAAEPLVTSPVAIDWGADGRLWVCEMFDYPMGTDQNWQPGGRVKFLEDSDGDGRYDKATTFLENLPFPTGVTAWGRGVLVCAAPDILHAQDADGDGKADRVEKLFSGFATDNYQARVNSLTLGLDNWIYGANGLLGGVIMGKHGSLEIRNRDFRFRPMHGPMETVTGLTQQGRVRDDWGRWFGCDNGTPLFHYPHEERYLRRNPHVAAPAPTVRPKADFDVGRVYPISRTLERFNDPDNTNRMTSACGLGLYRDTLLGEQYADNAFVCEPVHNLVHRLIISGEGPGITQRRADDEKGSEFLASTDNWFRPVQVRTGPDGAMYVVDMYRFLIEHPRWIPAKRLAELDVRAGADRGRIYRVRAKGTPSRPVRDLTKLSGSELAAALDSPNGTERDRVHVELLVRQDASAVAALERLATGAKIPPVRVQALAALDGLDGLKPPVLEKALSDAEAWVRRHAVRICEPMLTASDSPDAARIAEQLLRLESDPSAGVRRQLAYTLGEWTDRRAGEALARLAVTHAGDAEMRVAVLSSAVPHCRTILAAVGAADAMPGRSELLAGLVATVPASGDASLLAQAVAAAVPRSGAAPDERTFKMLASLLEPLRQRAEVPADVQHAVRETMNAARRTAINDAQAATLRAAAIELLAWGDGSPEDIESLCRLVVDADPVRAAAISALRRRDNPDIAERLIAAWPRLSPSVRTEIIGLLLGREVWSSAVLQAVKKGRVRPNEIPLADQQRLLRSADEVVRQLATEVFAKQESTTREEVIARYQSVASLVGNAGKGQELFTMSCSACHALGGVGHDVAPSLTTLRSKDVDYFVKNILDPSAVVEPRFVSYDVTLKDRRLVSGIIKSETAAALTIQSGGGVVETVARPLVKEIRASKLSMMPEGFEEALNPQDLADVIAFLKQDSYAPDRRAVRTPAAGDDVARDPAAVAKVILDPKLSSAAREAAVAANPQFAAELIVEMTRDLTPGTKAEYERIPWIWRVAVACGRRNDANQMKRVLDASLPRADEPLRDWQAVVIGGGIINGISERGQWPGPRIEEILKGDEALLKRYRRSPDLASAMTDDEKVPTPTRYDALRMLGVEPWGKRGEQLVRYLAKDVHPELQQGAVSGIADVNEPEAAAALVAAMAGLTESNRNLALDALLRDEARVERLLDAIVAGKVKSERIGEARRQRLLEHSNAKLRERAASVLKSAS